MASNRTTQKFSDNPSNPKFKPAKKFAPRVQKPGSPRNIALPVNPATRTKQGTLPRPGFNPFRQR